MNSKYLGVSQARHGLLLRNTCGYQLTGDIIPLTIMWCLMQLLDKMYSSSHYRLDKKYRESNFNCDRHLTNYFYNFKNCLTVSFIYITNFSHFTLFPTLIPLPLEGLFLISICGRIFNREGKLICVYTTKENDTPFLNNQYLTVVWVEFSRATHILQILLRAGGWEVIGPKDNLLLLF